MLQLGPLPQFDQFRTSPEGCLIHFVQESLFRESIRLDAEREGNQLGRFRICPWSPGSRRPKDPKAAENTLGSLFESCVLKPLRINGSIQMTRDSSTSTSPLDVFLKILDLIQVVGFFFFFQSTTSSLYQQMNDKIIECFFPFMSGFSLWWFTCRINEQSHCPGECTNAHFARRDGGGADAATFRQ